MGADGAMLLSKHQQKAQPRLLEVLQFIEAMPILFKMY